MVTMLEKLSEKISVFYIYSRERKISQPLYLKWQGRILRVSKIGLHHTIRDGQVLVHVFCVVAGGLFFKLHFDTQALSWTVKEVSDGNAS